MNRTLELLIKYYRGEMSKMKLAKELGMSFSKLKVYLFELEKAILKGGEINGYKNTIKKYILSDNI